MPNSRAKGLILLERGRSDKSYDINNNTKNATQTDSQFIFTHPFLTLRSLSPHTTITNLHIFPISRLFIPVSGWLTAVLIL